MKHITITIKSFNDNRITFEQQTIITQWKDGANSENNQTPLSNNTPYTYSVDEFIDYINNLYVLVKDLNVNNLNLLSPFLVKKIKGILELG